VVLNSGDTVSTTSYLFKVSDRINLELINPDTIQISTMFFLLLIVVIIAYILYERKKIKVSHKAKIRKIKSLEKKRNLKRKLNILEDAYSGGYVSRESYKKVKSRIRKKTK
jgi:hypothetical protein